MELPIKWSPEAVEDLEQIVEYIEKDSEYYATAVVSETLNIVQKIEEYPLSGRKVPEICVPRQEKLQSGYRKVKIF